MLRLALDGMLALLAAAGPFAASTALMASGCIAPNPDSDDRARS